MNAPAVPQYEVHTELGRGRGGVVYKATYRGQRKNNLRPDQEVALKIIPSYRVLPNEVLYQARIRHISVIQIYDVIRVTDNDGRVYIAVVMELADPSRHDLPGSSLWSCIRSTVLENIPRVVLQREPGAQVQAPIVGGEPMVRWIFLQVASALDFLHRHPLRICDRDFKAENVLVVSFEPHADGVMRPVCKLADLGFGEGSLTNESRARLGALFHVPPEKFALHLGNQLDGSKGDVWAAGMLLYVLQTGLVPFIDRATVSDREIMVRATSQEHINNLFVNLERLGASPELVDLLKQMLKIKPEERITMQQVIHHSWSKKLDSDIVAQVAKVAQVPTEAAGDAAAAADAPLAFPCWTLLTQAAEEAIHEAWAAYNKAQDGEFVPFGWNLEQPYDQVEQMLHEVAAAGRE